MKGMEKQELQGPAFCRNYLEGRGCDGGSVCGDIQVRKLSYWVVKSVKSCCWLRAGWIVILNRVRDQMVPLRKKKKWL